MIRKNWKRRITNDDDIYNLFLQVPLYALAQFTGAIAASFTLREVLDPIKRLGTTSPSGSAGQALAMEIVVTFVMMFVTSAVATDTKAVCITTPTYIKSINFF